MWHERVWKWGRMWCGGMGEKKHPEMVWPSTPSIGSKLTLNDDNDDIERMGNEEFVKVYLSSVEGMNRRERPLGRWEDRVKEYVSEKGVRGNGLE